MFHLFREILKILAFIHFYFLIFLKQFMAKFCLLIFLALATLLSCQSRDICSSFSKDSDIAAAELLRVARSKK